MNELLIQKILARITEKIFFLGGCGLIVHAVWNLLLIKINYSVVVIDLIVAIFCGIISNKYRKEVIYLEQEIKELEK